MVLPKTAKQCDIKINSLKKQLVSMTARKKKLVISEKKLIAKKKATVAKKKKRK